MDPDQTAPAGAVWSRSTLFAQEASKTFRQTRRASRTFLVFGPLRFILKETNVIDQSVIINLCKIVYNELKLQPYNLKFVGREYIFSGPRIVVINRLKRNIKLIRNSAITPNLVCWHALEFI